MTKAPCQASGERDGRVSQEFSDIAAASGGISAFLRTFASEKRVRVLCYLADRDRSVSELVELMGAAQPTVSRLLTELRYAGLVQRRRQGRTVCYRLSDQRARQQLEFVRSLVR